LLWPFKAQWLLQYYLLQHAEDLRFVTQCIALLHMIPTINQYPVHPQRELTS